MKFQQIRTATAIITYGNSKILLDPMLSDKGTFEEWKGTPNSHLRNPLNDLPLSIEEIIDVDAVIATHLHPDHFDKVAMERLPKDMPIFCQNENDYAILIQNNFSRVTILTEKGVTFGSITLVKTPAQHYSDKSILTERKNSMDACGVILKHADEKTIYIMGDTVWFDGLKTPLNQYKPDLVIVNAGHAQTDNGISIIMGTDDVYEVVKHAPYAQILATHMDGLNHLTSSREALREFAIKNGFSDILTIPLDSETVEF